jgi:2-dehydro-3-deoxygluconokinase
MSVIVDVLGLGEPMVEFSQVPGEPGRFLHGFGGDTMNAVIAAARQGARTGYVTRLGADEFGQQLLDLWQREGVDATGVVIDNEAPTAVYFITHGPSGHVFSYRRAGSAASRLAPADLPLDVIAGARFLHVSGISQAISATACDAVFAAIDHARSHGVRISYDSNLRLKLWPLPRARAIVQATIPLADYFMPSLDDVQMLSGFSAPDAIFDWALGLGARRIALKLGPEGVLAGDASGRERIPGLRVDVVDASGAGDCFAGALLARLAAGDPFLRAARYANAAAALNCTGYGAVAPLPGPGAVLALLARSGGA